MNYVDTELLSSTSTVEYPYSRDEIIDEIVHHANKMVEAHWLFRGEHMRRLRYWTEKLEALNPT